MPYTKDISISEVMKQSRDVMFIADDRQFIDANDAALKMFGVSSKEAFLKMHPAAFSPEFQHDGTSSFLKANKMIDIALKEGFHRFEWLHKNLKEEPFDVEVTLIIFEDGDKSLSFVQIRELSSFIRL
ncbi:MAG: hypothetical protein COA44_07205 [Arcobacter sp.]|nr:MAG: hypothetical protein COA44_07205 [Arcobacter sp.]